MKRVKPQQGNIFVMILVAIALLAALSMSIMRSDVTDADSVAPEQAKVIASQIMGQARGLEQAVQTLIAKGCSEQTLSFANDVEAGYTNVNAPVDGSCDVFKRAGAGLAWPTPPGMANDGSSWLMLGGNHVKGVSVTDNGACASGCIDLLAVLPNLSANVCKQLNVLAGVTPVNAFPEETDNFDATTKIAGFDGAAVGEEMDSNNGELLGKRTGCFKANEVDGVPLTDSYWFYHVLVVR